MEHPDILLSHDRGLYDRSTTHTLPLKKHMGATGDQNRFDPGLDSGGAEQAAVVVVESEAEMGALAEWTSLG